MNSKNVLISIVTVAMAQAYSRVALADFDFSPGISNGQIVTGGHDDEIGIDVPSLHVANYDFGENDEDPYNIGDPGFNTGGASPFTPASELRFVGENIGSNDLLYWDGTGQPSFSAAPSGVSVWLTASPTRRAVFSSDSFANVPDSSTSLLISSFASNGALHFHLGSSIFENGDQVADSVPVGAYLVSFELINPGTGIAASDPLFIVYNNGLSDAQNDAAVDAANATFVPEPTGIALLSGVGWMMGRRLRRRPRAHRP